MMHDIRVRKAFEPAVGQLAASSPMVQAIKKILILDEMIMKPAL